MLATKSSSLRLVGILALALAVPAWAHGPGRGDANHGGGTPPSKPVGPARGSIHSAGLLGDLIFPCQADCVAADKTCDESADSAALTCISGACSTEITAAQTACAADRTAQACRDAATALQTCAQTCLTTRQTAIAACRTDLITCRTACTSTTTP